MRTKSTASTLTLEPSRVEVAVGEYIEFPDTPKNSPFRPNKQYYVEALGDGTMVGIHSKKEYPTFFKLFTRYKEYHKLDLQLYIRQVKPDLWLLIPQDPSEPKPGSLLDSDFREHGRYKWYAEQLNKGEVVTVDTEAEATKCRRAWMLYTRPEQRSNLRALIELKGKKYSVYVVGL